MTTFGRILGFLGIALAIGVLAMFFFGSSASKNINGTPDGLTVSPSPSPSTSTHINPYPGGITYTNSTYGFLIDLPKSWEGYTATETPVEFGTKITLRHPQWTAAAPRMDIPVLVYTTTQWNTWKANNFDGYPTAAPIGPSERGHNSAYVFATAPRYNFTFLTGFEEVDEIVQHVEGFDAK